MSLASPDTVDAPTSDIKTIYLKGDYQIPTGLPDPQALEQLETQLGTKLTRFAGGISKESYLTTEGNLVQLLKTNERNLKQQSQNQIEFYLEASIYSSFKQVVAPLMAVIRNESGEAVGMIQQKFGVSLEELKKQGVQVGQEAIDKFIENYRQLIKDTGKAHGDFVLRVTNDSTGPRYTFDHDQLRFSPDGLEIRFVDYNGRNGGIAFYDPTYQENRVIQEGDSNYEEIRDSDPERTKEALCQLFGYST